MEEITLSVPSSFSDSPAATPRTEARPDEAAGAVERLASGFVAAARSRDRLVLTQRRRRQRQEAFELQLKRLVKTAASETASVAPDRRSRAEVRARSYATMMVLARLLAQDQARTAHRSRRVFRWAMASAAIGSLGILFTLIANGWLPVGASLRP